MLPELIANVLSVIVVAQRLLNPAEAISAFEPLAVVKIKEFVFRSVDVRLVAVRLVILPVVAFKSSETLTCIPKKFVEFKIVDVNPFKLVNVPPVNVAVPSVKMLVCKISPTVKLSDKLALTPVKSPVIVVAPTFNVPILADVICPFKASKSSEMDTWFPRNKLLAVNVPVDVKPELAVINPEIVGVAVQVIGPMVKLEPLIVVSDADLPRVNADCVAVPIFIATPVAVSNVGAKNDVAAVTVPVKFAALEIVCALIKPEVIVPMLDRFLLASMICVPLSCNTVEAPEKFTTFVVVFKYVDPIVVNPLIAPPVIVIVPS